VTKFEVKSLIKALKEKKIVWYASDQNFIGKNAVNINFFEQEAPTTPAISRFVEMTECSVLPYFPKRLSDGSYSLCIYPEISNEDCTNPENFLQQFYGHLESHIIENKEQFRALRDIKAANAMAKMGEYAPSFGMIGTLFGLIFMLGGMAMPPAPGVDPTAALISNMAIALITTLYGALFAFFFFLPFSDHLKYVNDDKKVESALHLEAAMLLYDKVHPIMVQERLNAFLARKDRFVDE
jgi:hypothetical protein